MKEWREERCSEQPDELQQISETSFMQRKNITEVKHDAADNMPAWSEYTCQCRELSVAEYTKLRTDQNEADTAYAIMLAGGDIDE